MNMHFMPLDKKLNAWPHHEVLLVIVVVAGGFFDGI